MRRRGFFIASVFALFLAVFLVLEIFLRSTHAWGAKISWSEPDSLIAWKYSPNGRYWFRKENDHAIQGRLNSDGWRDHDWPSPKPLHSIRVAVLGDSFVSAYQVEAESTFVEISEKRLEKDLGVPVEIMNFGRDGFTTTEEFLVLSRDVLRFSPDLVVLFFYPENDINDASRPLTMDIIRPFFKLQQDSLTLDTSFRLSDSFRNRRMVNPLKRYSALISLIIDRVNLLMYSFHGEESNQNNVYNSLSSQGHIQGALSLATGTPDSAFVQAYQLNKRLLADINQLCIQHTIPFVLASVNLAAYTPERIERIKKIDSTFDPLFFDRDLGQFAEKHGFRFIGLQAVFQDFYLKNGRPLQWTHWNYEGHRIVAQIVAESLRQRLKLFAEAFPSKAMIH
jgi:hypothetical protein